MKKMKLLSVFIITILLLTSCGGKTTEQCKDDVRAYEFGREMQTMVDLGGGSSLSKAIEEYANGLGVNPPYEANNECVIRGYKDAENDIESPYNKEGKNWTSF